MVFNIFTRKVPITELADCALSSRTAQLLCPPALLDAVLVGERHPIGIVRGEISEMCLTRVYSSIATYACTLLQNFSIWLHC